MLVCAQNIIKELSKKLGTEVASGEGKWDEREERREICLRKCTLQFLRKTSLREILFSS